MDYLLIYALIIIVIILLVLLNRKTGISESNVLHQNRLLSDLSDLKNDVRDLRKEVTFQYEQTRQKIKELSLKEDKPPAENEIPHDIISDKNSSITEVFATAAQPEEAEPTPKNLYIPHDLYAPDEKQTEETKAIQEEKITDLPPVAEEVFADTENAQHRYTEPPPAPVQSKIDTWLRNNPDLEKFIGENLINKIGIAILVLGIGFFVKYAIDKDWINETGRVCIGLACGGILIGLAHFTRKNYRSFSSVLAGGGIAVFYFTIAFGFHQYHLMSQTAAFIMMVVITVFAMSLSVLYDRLELAVIATVGGFLAPFLVSSGEGNYIILFTYLVILNSGILSLAYFKRWPAINIIALFFTEIIYAGWMATTPGNPTKHISYPLALMFATIFYFLFLGMNMINQVKNKMTFRPFDFVILLLISSSYFAAGIFLLHLWNNGAYQGLFTLALGIVNLSLAYYVYVNGKADRNLLFLLIGITLTFITLTIPIQLHGHAITMFWSAEFVLLYWLSVYSGIRIFKYSSLLISALTLISLLMDWEKVNESNNTGLVIIYDNVQGIVTNIIAILAFSVASYLIRKYRNNDLAANVALIISAGLLFITCIFGVNLYYHSYNSYAVPNVYHLMITEVFALIVFILIEKKKINVSPWSLFILLVICFAVFLLGTPLNIELRNNILSHSATWPGFYAHWADSVLLGILFYKTIQAIRQNNPTFSSASKILSVVISVLAIIFLSIEVAHLYVIAAYRGNNIYPLVAQYNKAGLTVLWALSSFALMWLGMKHGQKNLRIISLILFSIVLLKLFLIDISNISEGGKILAFILLGVLLLTVSFMYQKLKKIIIDDKTTKE